MAYKDWSEERRAAHRAAVRKWQAANPEKVKATAQRVYAKAKAKKATEVTKPEVTE